MVYIVMVIDKISLNNFTVIRKSKPFKRLPKNKKYKSGAFSTQERK